MSLSVAVTLTAGFPADVHLVLCSAANFWWLVPCTTATFLPQRVSGPVMPSGLPLRIMIVMPEVK